MPKKNKIKINKTIKDKKAIKKKNKKGKRLALMLIVTFFVGILLIISTYAWFSVSLNVKVKRFDVVVSSDSGLFISLDGINFSDSIELSVNSVITNLKNRYPTHTNQWALAGLWPVSSNGINHSNQDKFQVFAASFARKSAHTKERYMFTRLLSENQSGAASPFIAFDIFLKNVTGSPFSDNLYLDEGTSVTFSDDTEPEIIETMEDVLNSIRFGFLKIGSVPLNSDIKTIQGIKCNNQCEFVIYEPNSAKHSNETIERIKERYDYDLVDGEYLPTYGVIKAGSRLEFSRIIPTEDGYKIDYDPEYFALQRTITSFENSIFKIPNAITKMRIYVWIEGQDFDSLETNSDGASVNLVINFVKDLASYEQ